MAALHEFTLPVRRSIIRRDLWVGIPMVPLMVIVFLTILFVLTFEKWAFLLVTVVLIILARKITKQDEWLLDIIIFSMFQPDQMR